MCGSGIRGSWCRECLDALFGSGFDKRMICKGPADPELL